MNKRCIYAVTCALAYSPLWTPSVAQSPDAPYLENISRFIENATELNFDATYDFEHKEIGFQHLGQVSYKGSLDMSIRYSKDRGYWRYRVEGNPQPLGEWTNEELAQIGWNPYEETGKGRMKQVNYDGRRNAAVILDPNNTNYDPMFKLYLQDVDPMRFLDFAIPSPKAKFKSLEKVGEKIYLRYEHPRGAIQVVELDAQFSHLPTRVYWEDPDNALDEHYRRSFFEFEYEENNGEIVVKNVEFLSSSNSGRVSYRNASYTSPIEDNEFEVAIPADVWYIQDYVAGTTIFPQDGKVVPHEESIFTDDLNAYEEARLAASSVDPRAHSHDVTNDFPGDLVDPDSGNDSKSWIPFEMGVGLLAFGVASAILWGIGKARRRSNGPPND